MDHQRLYWQLMAVSGLFLASSCCSTLRQPQDTLGAQVYNDYAHWLHEEAFVPIFPHGGFIQRFPRRQR